MKEISLTQNKIALVDDDEYEKLSKHKWTALKNGNNFYAIRRPYINKKYIYIRMHREILNFPKDMEIDHIDGNGLNNQKNNLRICNHFENTRNMRKHIDGKAIYKGISFQGKYIRARIRFNNKNMQVGYFKTQIEAAIAYDKVAKKYFGKFACLNFPETVLC